MNSDDRIAALEKELARLRAAFADYGRMHQELGGQARMFEAALLALISSHPRPDVLGLILQDHLERVEAGVVAEAQTDEHLKGVHAGQELLMLALATAYEKSGTSPPKRGKQS